MIFSSLTKTYGLVYFLILVMLKKAQEEKDFFEASKLRLDDMQ